MSLPSPSCCAPMSTNTDRAASRRAAVGTACGSAERKHRGHDDYEGRFFSTQAAHTVFQFDFQVLLRHAGAAPAPRPARRRRNSSPPDLRVNASSADVLTIRQPLDRPLHPVRARPASEVETSADHRHSHVVQDGLRTRSVSAPAWRSHGPDLRERRPPGDLAPGTSPPGRLLCPGGAGRWKRMESPPSTSRLPLLPVNFMRSRGLRSTNAIKRQSRLRSAEAGDRGLPAMNSNASLRDKQHQFAAGVPRLTSHGMGRSRVLERVGAVNPADFWSWPEATGCGTSPARQSGFVARLDGIVPQAAGRVRKSDPLQSRIVGFEQQNRSARDSPKSASRPRGRERSRLAFRRSVLPSHRTPRPPRGRR